MKTPAGGCETAVHLCIDEDIGKLPTGPVDYYYADCKPRTPNPEILDADLTRRIWEQSAPLVNLQ